LKNSNSIKLESRRRQFDADGFQLFGMFLSSDQSNPVAIARACD
jgi:hypothetical protein